MLAYSSSERKSTNAPTSAYRLPHPRAFYLLSSTLLLFHSCLKCPSMITFSISSSSPPNSALGLAIYCLFTALSFDMCLHLCKSDSVWSQIFLPLPHFLHHLLQLHAPMRENSGQLFPGFAYCQLPPISFRVIVSLEFYFRDLPFLDSSPRSAPHLHPLSPLPY